MEIKDLCKIGIRLGLIKFFKIHRVRSQIKAMQHPKKYLIATKSTSLRVPRTLTAKSITFSNSQRDKLAMKGNFLGINKEKLCFRMICSIRMCYKISLDSQMNKGHKRHLIICQPMSTASTRPLGTSPGSLRKLTVSARIALKTRKTVLKRMFRGSRGHNRGARIIWTPRVQPRSTKKRWMISLHPI